MNFLASEIIEYETEGLSEEREAELMQHLINSGIIWSLQGAYQRRAQELVEAGVCHA